MVFRCLRVSEGLVDLLPAPLAVELVHWAAPSWRCKNSLQQLLSVILIKHTGGNSSSVGDVVGSLCVWLFVLQAAVFAFGVKTAAAEEAVFKTEQIDPAIECEVRMRSMLLTWSQIVSRLSFDLQNRSVRPRVEKKNELVQTFWIWSGSLLVRVVYRSVFFSVFTWEKQTTLKLFNWLFSVQTTRHFTFLHLSFLQVELIFIYRDNRRLICLVRNKHGWRMSRRLVN